MSYKQDNLQMKRFIEGEIKSVGRCMPKPIARNPQTDLRKFQTKTA
jgi:hypothetical protein